MKDKATFQNKVKVLNKLLSLIHIYKGYNDIFIPNLMVLSPTYAEYKKALDNVNDRMCRELGLYYDLSLIHI